MSSLNVSRLLLISLPLVNFGPIPGGKLTFAHLIAFGLLVIWAVKDRLRLGHPSFAFALVFLLLVASNVLLGVVGDSNAGQITQLVNYAFMMGIMVVAYTLALRNEVEPRRLLEDYFHIGVIYSAISLVLYVYGTFNGAFLYAVTDFFNIANTFDRGGLSTELSESVLPRITGLSPEPSFWSIYLCTVLAVGIAHGRKLFDWRIAFIALVIALTLARTGMVVLAIVAVYLVMRRSPLLFVWIICLTLMGLFAFVEIDFSGADSSITQRFGSVADGWQAFVQSPLFGLGWGGFKEYSQVHRLDYPLIFNYYLQVAAEGGLIGLALLCIFLVSLIINSPKAYRVVLLTIFVAWLSAPAYNLAYVWFLFGVLLAAKRRTMKGHACHRHLRYVSDK
ncbi:O-antigen ligase family protein [Roseateles cavernae]|uniref:O-antigen ligase family protein n=1 Tax=Roseateles cavernae TaxID=3153578 RepID=UPI0032E383EB